MNVESIKIRLLVKYPFFGSVVANSNFIAEPAVGTAGTDGKNIYYNPNFIESITDDQQTFIFAHEICHIAFDHIFRSEGKDKDLWNIATDSVVNAFLKQDGLPIVEGVVDIPEAINYDAEEMYKKLLEKKKQQQQQNQQQSSGSEQSGDDQQQSQSQQQSSSSGENSQEQDKQSQEQSGNGTGEDSQEEEKQQDAGHDTHSMWEQAVKKHKEEQEKSGKKESLLDKLLGKDKKEKEKTELEKKQEELEGMGEKDAFKKNLEDKKKQLEELKEAISKQASQAGTSTNRDVRNVNDIGTAKPIIDWRYVLREAIKYDVDWSYKNATLEDGVVVANLEEQPMPETEIVLDTSGSINEVLLKNFLRECKNILQHTKLKVGCFDTEFYGFHEIRTEEDIENMRFEGGGGTDFDVAVGAFSRRVENKIIFTDGEASMPDMPLDAIWIVFGGERINPKGGRVIHITPEQLDRLYSYEIESEIKGRSR